MEAAAGGLARRRGAEEDGEAGEAEVDDAAVLAEGDERRQEARHEERGPPRPPRVGGGRVREHEGEAAEEGVISVALDARRPAQDEQVARPNARRDDRPDRAPEPARRPAPRAREERAHAGGDREVEHDIVRAEALVGHAAEDLGRDVDQVHEGPVRHRDRVVQALAAADAPRDVLEHAGVPVERPVDVVGDTEVEPRGEAEGDQERREAGREGRRGRGAVGLVRRGAHGKRHTMRARGAQGLR